MYICEIVNGHCGNAMVILFVSAMAHCITRRRKQSASALKASWNLVPSQDVGQWVDSGIVSAAKPWSFSTIVFGTVLGLVAVTLLVVLLVPIVIFATCAEALHYVLKRDPYIAEAEEGRDDDVVLVMPGTCTFAFWQFGMMQYVCEQFDTRRAKVAAVSSGALCATLVIDLEKSAMSGESHSASERVRRRSQELFQKVDDLMVDITSWPLAFVSRLGNVLDQLIHEVMTEDIANAFGTRVAIGMRRLAHGIPALIPDSVKSFESKEELISAISASSHVGLVVRPMPWTFFRGVLCCDGVNPFSLYCFIEYMIQLRRGITHRTAPAYLQQGLAAIYSFWNCGAMRVILPRKGKHLWISPTMGGHLKVQYSLCVSRWWMAEQWRQGYAHAKELDKLGYWNALPRWKQTSCNDTPKTTRTCPC
mmetsp:Transcript_72793/g.115204  ORF Transcript_72793/g.115204 Transcript_72793/m.115204 type:complete len:420 (+) Transcript_72793:64-1323(+)